MTLYWFDITIPANTPESNPVEKEVMIEEEVIVRLSCHFPSGCRGMVYTAIYYGEEQIFPRPYGSYLHGDGETITWDEYYVLPSSPCVLTIRGWSPGTRYDHTIQWRIVALPRRYVFWWTVMDKFINVLTKIFRLAP